MIREFILDKDYETLKGWTNGYEQPLPDKNFIPDFGFVDFDDTGVKGIALIYLTNSKLCIPEYLTSNPSLPVMQRAMSIKRLIKKSYDFCDDLGLLAVNTLRVSTKFERIYLKSGAKVIGRNRILIARHGGQSG